MSKMFGCASALAVVCLAGSCGPVFRWECYEGLPCSQPALVAKISFQARSPGRGELANVQLVDGYLAAVAPVGAIAFRGNDWQSYNPYGHVQADAVPPPPAPATNPTRDPPTNVVPSTRPTQVIVLSGVSPKIKTETAVGGSEGSTFAVGRFVEHCQDRWIVHEVFVPIDTHPLAPLTLYVDGFPAIPIPGATFGTVTFEMFLHQGGEPTFGPSKVGYGFTLGSLDLPLNWDGKLHNDLDAAEWVSHQARVQKLKAMLP